MGDSVFVDTNILLRAFHKDYAEHQRARVLFDEMLDAGYQMWISRQVIREYLVQVTNPKTFVVALTITAILSQLRNIMSICHVADETHQVSEKLFELLISYPTQGKVVHDANIVATMLVYEIEILLTLNVADMKRFSDKIQIKTMGD